jgi:uncharacterized protein (DUF983 family)
MDESNRTIRASFSEGELGICPRCGSESVVTIETDVAYCVECGHLPGDDERDGAPPPATVEAEESA